MRELLHPVLFSLLVIAIGVIAHRGSRAAAKLAAGHAANGEDAGGKDGSELRAAGKAGAEDGASDDRRRLSA